MILVKAEVRPSPIHGLGLFALEPIAKNTVVSQWRSGVDFVLSDRDWHLLPTELREFLIEFAWRDWKGNYYGSSGISRYTNHSSTPNLTYDALTRASCANRAIAAGEELTENYSEFDSLFAQYESELR